MTTTAKLLYIASNGRSGSTILDMLLGAQTGCWTMGEVHLVNRQSDEVTLLCGCGVASRDCTFWGPILKRLKQDDDLSILNIFREKPHSGKVFRFWHLFDMWFRPHRKTEERATYCKVNRRLFDLVMKSAREDKRAHTVCLIDASKDPYRLFYLSGCNDIDLSVIHLMKDPRAYVHSMTKSDRGIYRLYKIIRISIRYVVENSIIEKAQTLLSSKCCYLLRYEDLAQNPGSILQTIFDQMELPLMAQSIEGFRQEIQHGVAGNLSRLDDRGIRLDTVWMDKLSSFEKRLIWLLTGFKARQYGYTSRPQKT